MKTLVLDGSRANDSMAAIILKSLRAHLPDAETVTLREKKIGNCAGDFFCWVRNPGICNTNYDNRINCSFPEAHQNNTALSICSEFARQSEFAWMGGLFLGGGEGLVHGVPLNDMGGRASSLKKALTHAAEALADGKPIPRSAQDLFSKPIIPAWLYTFIGGFGWKRLAKKYGMQKSLMRQPYLAENPTIENLKCVPYVLKKSN